MREFGQTIGKQNRDEIIKAAMALFNSIPKKRNARASEFELEVNDDPVCVQEVDVRWTGGRIRVALTTPDARPPFEWLIEITSNIGETDYFKHYLIQENVVVLAQRKVLTPIDEREAKVILDDLATAAANS